MLRICVALLSKIEQQCRHGADMLLVHKFCGDDANVMSASPPVKGVKWLAPTPPTAVPTFVDNIFQ